MPSPASQQRAVTIPIRRASAFITRHHRRHAPPVGAQFAVGITRGTRLVGVAILGRPVPPAVDDGATAEVTRTGTDGSTGVEVALYRAAWSLVRVGGYRRLITHTQTGEVTRGLREVGLRPVATLPPRAGTHTPKRARTDRGVDGVCRTRWETAATQAATPAHPAAVPATRHRISTITGQNQHGHRPRPPRHTVPGDLKGRRAA
jgi:hypothetical protein